MIINIVKGGVSSGTVGGEWCLDGGGGAAVGQPAALRHPYHPEHQGHYAILYFSVFLLRYTFSQAKNVR